MRSEAPRPTKRAILPPITAEHLDAFVHPGGVAVFESPFLPPAELQTTDPHTYAAAGFFCHRTTYAIPDVEPHPAAYARAQSLPWGRFQDYDTEGLKHRWRPLADAETRLFKFPPKPIWEKSSRRFNLRNGPFVRVGNATMTHLPILQLLARLPRAEVFLGSGIFDPVLVRYRYGQAIIPPLSKLLPNRDRDQCNLEIFRSVKGPNMGGGLV